MLNLSKEKQVEKDYKYSEHQVHP